MTTDADTQMDMFQKRLAALEQEIAEISVSDISLDEYLRRFLEQTVAVLAVGGAVYRITDAQELQTACHINLTVAGLQDNGPQQQLAAAAFGKVIETRAPVVLPGNDGTNLYDGGLGQGISNTSRHTLLFVPVIEVNRVAAILLLISPEDVDPRAVRGYLGFVMGLCSRAGIFLQKKRAEDLQARLDRSARIREYISALHSSLDPRRACYALANYGQELLGVYRCTVGTFSRSGKFRVEAVSGLETVAVKSSLVQTLAQVTRHVCRSDKPLLVDNPEAARKPDPDEDDTITAARLYMLEAGSLVMGIFPIHADKTVVGALIVEKATEEPIDSPLQKQIDSLLVEAGTALDNCLRYRHLPFGTLLRLIGAARDRVFQASLARRLFWTAVIVALIAAPFLITRDLKVVGSAELIPVQARIAYARVDGVLESVNLPPDRLVDENAVLARLDAREIETEIRRLENALAETSIALTQQRNIDAGSLAAARLQSQLEALQAEKNFYQTRLEQHRITAPVAGRVITPEHQIRQLYNKPVSRGDSIFEIVPADTPWQLTVRIPEDEAGDLLHAYDNLPPDQTLSARLILNAFPNKIFQTHLLSVAPRARVHTVGEDKYRNVIEVYLAQPYDPDHPDDPQAFTQHIDFRQGLEGKVAIQCGSRNLFYILTHEFVDFIRISTF